MKKKLSAAMAAAMAVSAVAPVVASADTIAPLAFEQDNIKVRLADGYKTDKVVLTRTDLYNTNGTKDREDDTLKAAYKDAEILISKEDKKDSYKDEFVLVEKETDISKVNEAKAHVETAKTLIEEAKKDGAEIKVSNRAAKIVDGVFVDSRVQVTVTPKEGEVQNYIFFGAKDIKDDEKPEQEVTGAELYNEVFKSVVAENGIVVTDGEVKFDLAYTSSNYKNVNIMKYTIEKNLAKFDIVKEEQGAGNSDLRVDLYVKGSDQEAADKALTLVFENFAKVDEDLIIDMPLTGDFVGHWAEGEILDAMYAGHVDAVENFRPEDSITRAEFAKIACTVLGDKIGTGFDADEEYTETFHDVSNDDWFRNYVGFLQENKIVMGDGENYRPNDNISRQEVAIIISNVLNEGLIDLEDTVIGYDEDGKEILGHEDVVTKFLDDKEIDVWADNSVKFLNEKTQYGEDNKPVVQGSEGKFYAKDAITRAESLVMTQRAAVAKVTN